ncbi:MAG: DnaJ domain-containing protein [Chloroflexi bacterium]|nr:DnaJ domain-containing protein [Chloroflexota bacterium]
MTSLEEEDLPQQDPYAVLGVDRNADMGTIKRAYFQLVRQYPPEREPTKFKEIRASYEKINTPERRSRTNLFLLQPPPGPRRRHAPRFDLSVHGTDVINLALELGVIQVLVHDDFHKPKLS